MAAASHPIFARLWARMSAGALRRRDRAALVAGLHGRVLEIGAGDGEQFAYYPPTVTSVVAIEPEPYLRALALERAAAAPVAVEVRDGTAEALGADDASFDAVVCCLVLCSVPDQAVALGEVRRVLAPGGELRFQEHVVAHARAGAVTQRALDRSGVWPRLAAGCHVARDTRAAIAAAGFAIDHFERSRLGAMPMVAGVARPA